VLETLEFLREEAIRVAREIRGTRNNLGMRNSSAFKWAQELTVRIRDRDGVLGVARCTRIRRHGAESVWGLDPDAQIPDIEAAARWVDTVVENIENELAIIDRRRNLYLTFCCTVAALAAAVLAFVGIVIGVVTLFEKS